MADNTPVPAPAPTPAPLTAIAIAKHAVAAENTLRPQDQAKEADKAIVLAAVNPLSASAAKDFYVKEIIDTQHVPVDPSVVGSRVQNVIDTVQKEKASLPKNGGGSVPNEWVIAMDIAQHALASTDTKLTAEQRKTEADDALAIAAALPKNLGSAPLQQFRQNYVDERPSQNVDKAIKIVDDDLRKAQEIMKAHLTNPSESDAAALKSPKESPAQAAGKGQQQSH
jgi:hypothetical protein